MRFLDFTVPDLAQNLALDEALLLDAEENDAGPILRIWESASLAVVLGASGRINEDVNRESCLRDGIEIFRRSSGGGTVLIGPGALNFTLVLPVDAEPGYAAVDVAQKSILSRSAGGLNELVRPGSPKLEVLGSADLTLDRRKCSGSAQRRLRRHFLVHASLLYDFPLEKIGQYLFQPRRQPAYREGRSHESFVTNFPYPRAKLIPALRSAWQAGHDLGSPSAASLKFALELVESRLARLDWIERL